MSSSCLTDLERQGLSVMHAFSGNDHISPFFRRVKPLIWKFLLKHQEFLQTFANVGLFSNVTEQTRNQLERFVCLLYGGKICTNVNELRSIIFRQKFSSGKSMDLTLLLPCQDNLNLRIERSCYVANLYSESIRLEMLHDSPSMHGWDDEGNAIWYETYFPDDTTDLLLLDDGNEESDYDNVESDENVSDDDDDEF